MTADRRKSLLYLTLTFVVGLFVGIFIPGTVMRLGGGHGRGGHEEEKEKRSLDKAILKAIKPNEEQLAKMKPIVDQAVQQINTLQNGCNQEVSVLTDSLKTKLLPILDEKQKEQLEKFIARGKERWKEHR